MMLIDMDAVTPMFRRYSRWIGETARRVLSDRSTGFPSPLVSGRIGETASFTSLMMRIGERL